MRMCEAQSVEEGRDRTKLERQRETRPCLCPYHTTIQPLSCRQSVRTDMISLDRGMGGFLMKVTGKEIFLLMVKVNSCSYLLTGSCLAVSQELQGRVQVWRWMQTLIISITGPNPFQPLNSSYLGLSQATCGQKYIQWPHSVLYLRFCIK